MFFGIGIGITSPLLSSNTSDISPVIPEPGLAEQDWDTLSGEDWDTLSGEDW